MDKPSQRNLTVKISEIFEMPLSDNEEVNPKFLGMLPPMQTLLSLNYERKTAEGTKCAPPLDPVWMDTMVEALSYMVSSAANAPDQIPMLVQLVCVRLALRVQAYANAKFPGYAQAMSAELYRVMTAPAGPDAKREAFIRCFNLRLQGNTKPCKVCDKKEECKFKGAFEAPKEGK